MNRYLRNAVRLAVGLSITLGVSVPGPATGQEKVKISMVHIGPATTPTTSETLGVLKASLEATGRADVIMYGSGSAYSNPTKFFELVELGVVDIAFAVHQFEPGRFPLGLLAGEPFITNDHVKGTRAFLRTVRNTPELLAEFKPNRILIVGLASAEQIHARKPIRSIDDLKGARVLAINPIVLSMIREVGGTVVALPQTAQYENFQKGVIDASSSSWAATMAFRTIEVTNAHLETNSIATPIYIIMNQKKYDSLPPDLRKILDDFSTEDSAARIAAVWDKVDAMGIEEAKKRGHLITPMSLAERAAMRKRFQHLADARIADLEKKGLPARRIYDVLSKAMAAEDAR
ncbi:MAG: hypothetical protein EXR27_19385 [Betaproteobacteria bacterium]|nr:hypothetical protein [Betaproteobacteria bacterium]